MPANGHANGFITTFDLQFRVTVLTDLYSMPGNDPFEELAVVSVTTGFDHNFFTRYKIILFAYGKFLFCRFTIPDDELRGGNMIDLFYYTE